MPYVTANGLSLYYEVEGEPDAPPVLLITGLSGDHRGWGPLPSLLRTSYRVISFDNRDSGLSQRAEAPYAIQDMARDAVGLLGELDSPPVSTKTEKLYCHRQETGCEVSPIVAEVVTLAVKSTVPFCC